VTHLGPSPSTNVTLSVTDGAHTITRSLGTLAIDTPTATVVDVRTLNDGPLTVAATDTVAALTGQDTTVLDTHAPSSSFSTSSSTACVVVPNITSTCSMQGTSTDALTNVQLVYVTGHNATNGSIFGRTATLASNARSTTWAISGAALSGLTPGEWTFTAQAQDVAGNFEAFGTNAWSVLVV
jgi:hypothetical protein